MTSEVDKNPRHPEFCLFGFGGSKSMCIYVRRTCFDRRLHGDACVPLRELVLDLMVDGQHQVSFTHAFIRLCLPQTTQLGRARVCQVSRVCRQEPQL